MSKLQYGYNFDDGWIVFSRIASHTEGEVRDILQALERIYHPSFPELNLRQ